MVSTRSSQNRKITNFFEKKEPEKKEEKKVEKKKEETKVGKKEKVKKEVSSSKKHKTEEDNQKSPVKENAFKKLKPSNSVKKEEKPLLNPGLGKDFDFEPIDPEKEMKIVSYNVGSLNASLKKGFKNYLEAENPDIICIQVSIKYILYYIYSTIN